MLSLFFQCIIGEETPKESQCEQIKAEILDDSLLTCSDGAFCPSTHTGSHCCVFASEICHTIVSGAGPDDEHSTLISSYYSELGGILATLYIIHRICRYYYITTGDAKLYSDNKGVITKMFQAPSPWNISLLDP